jgi:hypothetical protein
MYQLLPSLPPPLCAQYTRPFLVHAWPTLRHKFHIALNSANGHLICMSVVVVFTKWKCRKNNIKGSLSPSPPLPPVQQAMGGDPPTPPYSKQRQRQRRDLMFVLHLVDHFTVFLRVNSLLCRGKDRRTTAKGEGR